eukprot:CAMPEP_0119398654 /NCGR_PEP_ID=MMETSP1334-20130426/140955_1 /TAXON_ID=127549 /ORGANISM="Calcidiscus leptoporus, Strain RCC1130" /LENGTH=381 /DNA_ID=CAMNT_0007422523 /DNA_START=534 /DNA_END=1679 /DNA_ORIENTATION=-
MGAYLAVPVTSKESTCGQTTDSIQYGLSSMQGWRKSQEDAHLALSLNLRSSLFAVFDGHGGREVAAFAALHFAEVLQGEPLFNEEPGEALRRAFHRIDEMLLDESNLPELRELKGKANAGANSQPAQGNPNHSNGGEGTVDAAGTDNTADGAADAVPVEDTMALLQKLVLLKRMRAASTATTGDASNTTSEGTARICTLPASHVEAGCTAVVVLIRGSKVFVANAGDSRAVLCRAGQAVALSFDHKPSLPTELARIEAGGGWVTAQGRVNGNLNLSRALGDLKYKGDDSRPRAEQIISAEPDVDVHTISDGDDFIIIACDGIWDCLTNQQAVDFVRPLVDTVALDAIAERMLDHCLAADPRATQGIGGDNMTCVLVRLGRG